MNAVTVTSWHEALEALEAGSWSPALQRFRSTFCFRGMSRADVRLEHGLSWLAPEPSVIEHAILRSFRRYAGPALPYGHDSIWHWLALAQHHGLPTRLSDWTYSPLVALHFATAEASAAEVDGGVWAVNYAAVKEALPEVLRAALHAEEADVFTPETLDRVVEQLTDLDALAEEPFLVFVEPPSLNDRIVNQYALYSLFSRNATSLQQWLETHDDVTRFVRLDWRAKQEIRDRLDQANITERVLFPGLDGLCTWLRRYYSQRPDTADHAPPAVRGRHAPASAHPAGRSSSTG
jgi:hypothetical protein